VANDFHSVLVQNATSQVDRVVDIAALAFDDVGKEEKLRYQARIKETGEYLGYKLPEYWVCCTVNYATR